eukprot:PITA_07952
MLLTHLGFKVDFISWIMGCITDVSYAILINGAATSFFKGQRGLRQGCPLSPLLFLLVAEGLSQLIHKSKRAGKVFGIEAAVNLFITHLFFVDDILIFSNGSLVELKELKSIFDLFMKATGMQINSRKSQIIQEWLSRPEREQLRSLFPFEISSMGAPFKYLGFWLKPNAYRKEDWAWLIAKIEARIKHWSFKWLSRAGRLILIKSVLLAIPVYWAALTWVPKGVLEKIRRLCNRFLWAGSKESSKATLESFKVIEQGLAWKIENGEKVRIGKDPWVGCNGNYALSPDLILQLEGKDLRFLSQVEKPGFSSIWGQAWKNGAELELGQRWWNEWNVFTQELLRSNIRLSDRQDELLWAHAESGEYAPKDGYKFLMSRKGWRDPEWWAKQLWKLKCPPKSKILFWCILRGKIPTWENLQSRFLQGPGRCTLCKTEAETVNHLFLKCPESLKVWCEIGNILNIKLVWEGFNIQEVWQKWWNEHATGNLRNLPLIISWGIWIARNKSLFQDKEIPVAITATQGAAIYSSLPVPKDSSPQRIVPELQIAEGIPWAFFDGASQNNIAGAGFIIHLSPSHNLKASVGLGSGSNNYAELNALKLLLCWLIHKHILSIQIFGDSQNVIRWVNGLSTCRNQALKQILGEIQRIKPMFNSLSICHIFRERNSSADQLSKDGLLQVLGCWKIEEVDQGLIRRSDQPPFLHSL